MRIRLLSALPALALAAAVGAQQPAAKKTAPAPKPATPSAQASTRTDSAPSRTATAKTTHARRGTRKGGAGIKVHKDSGGAKKG